MDQVERARRFAQLAYSSALGEIVREFDQKRYGMRKRSLAGEAVRSQPRINEEAKLDGEQITATVKVQLKTLLDGYELNGVPIDDELATAIASELDHRLETLITYHCGRSRGPRSVVEFLKFVYPRLLRQNVGVSPAWIRSEINRRRFPGNAQEETINLYHVEGDAPRVNVKGADQFVNVVIEANRQLFADLRHKIEFCLRDGNERTATLVKLTALEHAQSPASFVERYTDFISAASNHILLLTPFIPLLDEMVHKVADCL